MTEPEKSVPEDAVKGLLCSLQNVVQSVQQLAETGVDKVRKGVFPGGTGLHGIYSVTVKADLQRPALTIEIGNPTPATPTATAQVPPTELVEEAELLRVLAEMPGIGTEDVKLELAGQTLKFCAEKGQRKYAKELTLPFAPLPGTVSHSCSDGILEIRIPRLAATIS
jgi:HSP20 family protein